MATSTALRNHLTCSVCLEIYSDPHELKCRHTFCLECLQKLLTDNVIQCPECRDDTPLQDIKKDFKNSSLVEILEIEDSQYKETCQDEHISEVHSVKCGMCNKPDKAVCSKCVDCEHFMCGECGVIHQGMKVCQRHQVVSVSVVVKNLHFDFQEGVKVIDEVNEIVKRKLEHTERNIQIAQNSQEKQLTQLAKIKDDMIHKIECYHKNMEEKVKSLTNDQILSLSKSKTLCEQMANEVQTTLSLLLEMTKSEDIAALIATKKNLDETLRKQVHNVRAKTSMVNDNVDSSVVIHGEDFSPEKHVKVSVQQIGPGAGNAAQGTLNFTGLTHNVLRQMKTTDIILPERIHFIGDALWCVTYRGGIQVYNKECVLIKTISHDLLVCCIGMTNTHRSEAVVVCGINTGLHSVSHSGNYLGCIAEDSYSDVCSYGEVLYTLNYNKCQIMTFYLEKDKWRHLDDIRLQHSDGNCGDKLAVNSSGICVSSLDNHCIYLYSLMGEFLLKVGQKGSGKPGLFIDPVVCDLDCMSNVLVCDIQKNCLQMYNQADRCWSMLVVSDNLECPCDTVISSDGKYMWVITSGLSGGMFKYSISNK